MIEKDNELLYLFLDESRDLLDQWEKVALELHEGNCLEAFNQIFRIVHNLKGTSRAVFLPKLGSYFHEFEDFLVKWQEAKLPYSGEINKLILNTHGYVQAWLEQIKTQNDFVPSDLEFNSLVMRSVPIEGKSSQVESQLLEKIKITAPQQQESIRISTEKIDKLMLMIGELSVYQSILWNLHQDGQQSEEYFNHSMYSLKKITRDIQLQSMTLRMNPVGGTFQKLERVIKDVSEELDKKVQTIVEGSDVELDKTILEKILDPLLHICRNAVDHGLENKEQRLANGKNEIAKIYLKAFQQPSFISIQIKDDGKGLNLERIRKKAIGLGWINEDSEINEDDLMSFIFRPGFSTAETVSNISGRGVGLDVVKNAVEDLGGQVCIKSVVNQGTEFTIKLPTNLSIIDALIVSVDSQKYALPVAHLDEIIDLNHFKLHESTKTGGMINLRNKVIPVENLSRYLPNIQSKGELKETIQERNQTAVVTHQGNHWVAFKIDKILSQQNIMVRKLGSALAQVPGFNGSTILGDGEPGFIIDLSYIVKKFLSENEKEILHAG